MGIAIVSDGSGPNAVRDVAGDGVSGQPRCFGRELLTARDPPLTTRSGFAGSTRPMRWSVPGRSVPDQIIGHMPDR
jgi:hypothetical protein